MKKWYLMQRFDLNEGFPRPSPQGIQPYIGFSFVLMDEEGNPISLQERGWPSVQGLSSKIAHELKRAQDKGHEIRGDVHPLYKEIINIEGDLEIYQSLPQECATFLRSQADVDIVYDTTP